MDASILNQVSEYLYPKQIDGQNLFKSMYDMEIHGDYKETALNLLNSTIEQIPSYVRHNTAFAYRITNQLLPTFLDYIEADKNKVDQKSDKQAQRDASRAVARAMASLGYEETFDGLADQDEIMQAIENDGDELVNGLLASKNPDSKKIAGIIKRIDTSLKNLEATLKSVSAISDSLVKGIEKIKSEFSDEGFDYGRDLTKIDPSEFSYLQNGYEDIFMLKYAKGELLQESSVDRKGLGDIIIAVDTSGSVFGKGKKDRYEIIELEMGIAMAISRIAAKNKCKVRITLYHTQLHHDSHWCSGSDEINAAIANIYSNNELDSGGTSFDNALNAIMARLDVSEYPSSRKPGIIFLTDGYDSLKQETIERLEQVKSDQGLKLYSYFVSSQDPRQYSQQLVASSQAAYWIDASKKIEDQIEAFIELS